MISTQPLVGVQNHITHTASPYCVPIDTTYPLHYCAFHGLRDQLKQVLMKIDPGELNKKDAYGNTALHIAIMLGHRDCAEALLSANCAVSIRNMEGWTSLSEAISYGSNSMTTHIYQLIRRQVADREKLLELGRMLEAIPDCQLEFEWEIVSWMPFISKMLPSDVCCLRKVGNCLRLDTSIVDLSGMDSTRGDLSIIFNPSIDPSMLILNHKRKTFQSFGTKRANFEHDVDVLRSTELLHMRLSMDKAVCIQSGTRHSRWSPSPGKTMTGKYHTTTYTINNLSFKTLKRYEHLKENQKRRQHHQQGERSRLSKRSLNSESEKPTATSRSASLSPPRGHRTNLRPNECNPAPVSWEAYRSGGLKPSQIYLGRKPELKRSEKRLRLTVSMTEDIPLNVPQLLDLLQVISPLNKFKKLREALQTGLPTGFPVRLEMPLFPTTMARVQFTDVKILNPTDWTPTSNSACELDVGHKRFMEFEQLSDLFVVPSNYRYSGEFRLAKPRKKQSNRRSV